jgi:hypothetical protein
VKAPFGSDDHGGAAVPAASQSAERIRSMGIFNFLFDNFLVVVVAFIAGLNWPFSF